MTASLGSNKAIDESQSYMAASPPSSVRPKRSGGKPDSEERQPIPQGAIVLIALISSAKPRDESVFMRTQYLIRRNNLDPRQADRPSARLMALTDDCAFKEKYIA